MGSFTQFIRRNREEIVTRPELVVELATGCVGLHTGDQFVPLSRGGGLALDDEDVGVAKPASRVGFRPFDASLRLRNTDEGLAVEIGSRS